MIEGLEGGEQPADQPDGPVRFLPGAALAQVRPEAADAASADHRFRKGGRFEQVSPGAGRT